MSEIEKKVNRKASQTVALLGIPFDEASTYMRGAALAPQRIREALHCGSANLCAESGVDLEREARWQDAGNMSLPSGANVPLMIEKTLDPLLENGGRVLSLGGDHSVTYPVLRAYARKLPGVNVLQLDAHPDLYDVYDGRRFTNACPFARIMEEGLAVRLVQVGIRTMNPHQREQAERFGVEVHGIREWTMDGIRNLSGPIYLSLDMDVLDPAFAPGVSHQEPGGMTTRDVLEIIQQVGGPVVGADIVEFNPKRDIAGITAMTAAKFARELIARMLE